MEASQLTSEHHCGLFMKLLHIRLIFSEIVKYLTLPDLISCSEVNRCFCTKFREYIHEKRNCPIRLVWHDRPCLQLKKLSELIANTSFVLPFNSVWCSEWETKERIVDNCSAKDHENIPPESYDMLLEKVHFTSFVIFWPRQTPEKILCPAAQCMKQIMMANAGILKTLTFRQSLIVDSILDFYQVGIPIRPRWLASLKRFIYRGKYNFVRRVHLQELLESSPNLQTISGRFHRIMFEETPSPRRDTGIVPLNKYKCIRDAHGLAPTELTRLAEEKPELKYLSFYHESNGTETFQRNDEANRAMTVHALNGLLRSSYSSLRVIKGDIFHLAIISREVNKACWPLPNVSTLDLFSTYPDLSYFKYMNLQRMFPKLSEIFIWPWAGEGIQNLELMSYETDFKYSDSTVKSLQLYSWIPEGYLRVVESTFPNLTHFTYHDYERLPEMCGALWKMNWAKMTTIRFCSLKVNFDVDGSFFGFTRDDKRFLESGNLDVEEFHHVSSQYSAFNFPSLKVIGLELEDSTVGVGEQPFPSNEIQAFPLISGRTAQQISTRFPGLRMDIIIEPKYIKPGARMVHDAYSTLVTHPGLIKISPCLHKHEHPHRKHHSRLQKANFSVWFK